MTKEQFILMIKDYQEQDKNIDRVHDIINWDSPIIDFGWKMMDLVIKTNFNENQADWIDWWLYDRISFDNSINEAYDKDGKEIDLDTPEKLWNFLQTLNDGLLSK